MITLRRSAERGYVDHGWLKSYHSFSFADFYDPSRMGYRNLRVINEDHIAPRTGFGRHAHRDMEIVSYVLKGALAHCDNVGNGTTILPGEVQRMSAGSGVQHSEFNHASDTTTHLLQIWIEPRQRGITPSYEQKRFDDSEKRGQLRLVASPDGHEGSVTLHADARLYAGLFDGEERYTLPVNAGRHAYVHVVRGELRVNGHRLGGGDAAEFDGEVSVELGEGRDAEVLLFDLS